MRHHYPCSAVIPAVPIFVIFTSKAAQGVGCCGLMKQELGQGRRLHAPGPGRGLLGERIQHAMRKMGKDCMSTACHQPALQREILNGVDVHLLRERVRRVVKK